MNKSITDILLQEYTKGFAFDESVQQQLNYGQMIALADMFFGWTLNENNKPQRSAWLTGYAEGLLAVADQLGTDWDPGEPEKLDVIGVVGRLAKW